MFVDDTLSPSDQRAQSLFGDGNGNSIIAILIGLLLPAVQGQGATFDGMIIVGEVVECFIGRRAVCFFQFMQAANVRGFPATLLFVALVIGRLADFAFTTDCP